MNPIQSVTSMFTKTVQQQQSNNWITIHCACTTAWSQRSWSFDRPVRNGNVIKFQVMLSPVRNVWTRPYSWWAPGNSVNVYTDNSTVRNLMPCVWNHTSCGTEKTARRKCEIQITFQLGHTEFPSIVLGRCMLVRPSFQKAAEVVSWQKWNTQTAYSRQQGS